jgi:hypothetical protein
VVEQVERLRRVRHSGKRIAVELGLSPATVSRILKRLGLNQTRALEPAVPMSRYERARPGEMIHIDIKKLGPSNTIAITSLVIPARPTKGRLVVCRRLLAYQASRHAKRKSRAFSKIWRKAGSGRAARHDHAF